MKSSTFGIHRENSNLPDMMFPILECGLHYYHPSSDGMVLVNTVANKKEMFTKREIEGADRAVSLQAKPAYPSKQALKWVIQSNQIQNCPVTVRDVEVAEQIYGKSVPALKGKTVRSQPPPVSTEIIKVPRDVLKLHKDLVQGMDIFFVNKQPFLITLTMKIYFTTTAHLPNRKIATIFKEWKRTYVYYFIRGFRIAEVWIDPEFEALFPLIADMKGAPRINANISERTRQSSGAPDYSS